MSCSNENFSTPVQRKGSRHLGLKRNNSSIKKTVSLEAAVTTKEAEPAAKYGTTTTTPRMQPQSDAKVNYRNQEDSNKNKCSAHTTPATPSTSCLLQRQSVSTNCRPYRLALSKRVREKMSKKRLEFHIANELEKEEEEQRLNRPQETEISETASQLSENVATCRVFEAIETSGISKSACVEKDPTEMSRDQLLVAIDQSRKELKAREMHACKAQELQQAINIWQIGFSTALSDLQKKIRPPVGKEVLLDQLRIPKEMIKYAND